MYVCIYISFFFFFFCYLIWKRVCLLPLHAKSFLNKKYVEYDTYVCMYVCMYVGWINRVRLPILFVVGAEQGK